jgi:menaquinone-dependent protoporphyrinogen oxidase
MKVLVGYASKHHATQGIAEAIGAALSREGGIEVEVQDLDNVVEIGGYDAFVLGSGVYAGHTLHEAEDFLRNNAQELRTKPIWLFSSGPIAKPAPKDEAKQVVELAELVGARDHRVFGGKLDKADLNFAERTIFTLVRAKEGDYRDWENVISWAEGIAQELLAPAARG